MTACILPTISPRFSQSNPRCLELKDMVLENLNLPQDHGQLQQEAMLGFPVCCQNKVGIRQKHAFWIRVDPKRHPQFLKQQQLILKFSQVSIVNLTMLLTVFICKVLINMLEHTSDNGLHRHRVACGGQSARRLLHEPLIRSQYSHVRMLNSKCPQNASATKFADSENNKIHDGEKYCEHFVSVILLVGPELTMRWRFWALPLW